MALAPSNRAGNAVKAHGAPLGDDELAATREALGWNYGPFEIPDDVLTAWRAVGAKGAETSAQWDAMLQHPVMPMHSTPKWMVICQMAGTRT